MRQPNLLAAHPLAALGHDAAGSAEHPSDTGTLARFEESIRPYSLNRGGMDWTAVARLAATLATERCDLKIYSYQVLAAFQQAEQPEPYLALAAALHALADLIEHGWERCLPRSPSRRQAQLKWLGEELGIAVKARGPRAEEQDALLCCMEQAARVSDQAAAALGLDGCLLQAAREALAAYVNLTPATTPVHASEPPPAEVPPTASEPAPPRAPPLASSDPPRSITAPAEPRRDDTADQLAALVIELAAGLRAASLYDAAPYWMLRALRWAGHELLAPGRAHEVAANQYRTSLPLPPRYGELRRQLAAQLAAAQHAEVISVCEDELATHPLWLDLQRFAAAALLGMGAVAAADTVRRQVVQLLASCPQLPRFRFADRHATPIADPETVAWLETLGGEARRSSDAMSAAGDAPAGPLRLSGTDDPGSAIRTLEQQLAAASTARRRFLCQLALAELLLEQSRSDIAMALTDALLSAIDSHQLATWEPALCQQALTLAVRVERAAGSEPGRLAVSWQRLCQSSPLAALQLGPHTD